MKTSGPMIVAALVAATVTAASYGGISGGGASTNGISGGGVSTNGISGGGVSTNGISGGGVSTNGISGGGVSTNGISGGGASTNGISGGGVAEDRTDICERRLTLSWLDQRSSFPYILRDAIFAGAPLLPKTKRASR